MTMSENDSYSECHITLEQDVRTLYVRMRLAWKCDVTEEQFHILGAKFT